MSDVVKEITAADFPAVLASKKPVVVDFYSSECPPCEALAPKYESVAGLFHEAAVVGLVVGARLRAKGIARKGAPTGERLDANPPKRSLNPTSGGGTNQ